MLDCRPPQWRNTCHFVKERPAFILFTAALLCMGFTAFLYATYVKYTTEQLSNTDMVQNWKKLSTELNQYEYCISKSVKNPVEGQAADRTAASQPKTDDVTQMVFTALLTVRGDRDTPAVIYANIVLDWMPYCNTGPAVLNQSVMRITAFKQAMNAYCAQIIVVVVTGGGVGAADAARTPPISGDFPGNHCHFKGDTAAPSVGDDVGTMTTNTHGTCPSPDSVKTQVLFSTDERNAQNGSSSSFLTDVDRTLISSRLMSFAYLVAIYCALIMLYSLFYRGPATSSYFNEDEDTEEFNGHNQRQRFS